MLDSKLGLWAHSKINCKMCVKRLLEILGADPKNEHYAVEMGHKSTSYYLLFTFGCPNLF